MNWFRETPESLRLLAEERAVVEASEIVCESLDSRKLSRTAFADALGVSRSEVTQRLSGERNVTLRSLASMLHVLDFDLELRVRDRRASLPAWRSSDQVVPGVRYATDNSPIRLVAPGSVA